MTKDIFKYIPEENLTTELLMFVFTEQMIQEYAEANFDRRLSDDELLETREALLEGEECLSLRLDLMHAAIEDALNEKR